MSGGTRDPLICLMYLGTPSFLSDWRFAHLYGASLGGDADRQLNLATTAGGGPGRAGGRVVVVVVVVVRWKELQDLGACAASVRGFLVCLCPLSHHHLWLFECELVRRCLLGLILLQEVVVCFLSSRLFLRRSRLLGPAVYSFGFLSNRG